MTDLTLINYAKTDTIMFRMFKNQISLILIITLAIIKVNVNKHTNEILIYYFLVGSDTS